ncbi:MAG TPA: efflux RND transporter periplasmic adaptor subunit [Gemmataceae bacterium]|nr:efflux RND transporter periplasmic adaptor subunit [Gemmataceae bacterium]
MNKQNTSVMASAEKRTSFIGWFGQALPTFAVLTLLAALAFVGHHSGWSMPKFGALFGKASDQKDDWCDEHGVPESICVECNESLMPKPKSTWCRAHGVHNCLFEHPEFAQVKTAPVFSQGDLDSARRALDLKERKENTAGCKTHLRRVQLASDEVVKKMGLKFAVAWPDSVVETVSVSGEIMHEQPRVAPVSSTVSGRVWHVTAKGVLGKKVKRGDVLAILDSAEVGKAKAELLQAHAQMNTRKATYDGLQQLGTAIIPKARLLEGELAYREAAIRFAGAQQSLINMGLPIRIDPDKNLSTEDLTTLVHFFGIPPEITAKLDARTTTANLISVLAPRDGVVSAVKASSGEMIEAGRPMFVVTDTSRMWLVLKVRSEDVPYLRIRNEETGMPGQRVKFRPDGANRDFFGELTWKSTDVDEKTRTVQFRAELPNPDGMLLAYAYGKGEVYLRGRDARDKMSDIEKRFGVNQEESAILIPTEAIHWEGDCHIVFVRDKNFAEPDGKKVYHVRSVRPGVTNGSNTEIIAGLAKGEIVETKNSATLRAELLRNNLGAG